jgi:hypothetical protein
MANGLPIIQAADPLGGLRLGLENFVATRLQALQNQQLGQQLGRIFPNLNLQGITDPRALHLAGQLGMQQQQQQGALALAKATPLSPTQNIAQLQLDRINLLQSKEAQGTLTQAEKDELQRSLQRNRPLVEFGALPGLTKVLTPEERAEQARQPLVKPLTPTEIKGVDSVVNSILGGPKTLPFGIRGGAAVPQSKMNELWEQTMLETGYEGRSKIAQKQIESRFDRKVRELNKGKGLGVLANQYQWDRKKYNPFKIGSPDVPKQPPLKEGFDTDLLNALSAIGQGADPNEVIREIGRTYPPNTPEFNKAWAEISPFITAARRKRQAELK